MGLRKNDRKNTLKQTKSQFFYKHTSHVTKAAGIEVLPPGKFNRTIPIPLSVSPERFI